MSLYTKFPFDAIRKSFQINTSLSFSDAITEDDIQEAFNDADNHFGESDDAIYTPFVTLWMFLSQMLFFGPARSCDAAVLRLQQVFALLGKAIPSSRSGGFCKARAKIKEEVPQSLILSIADKAEKALEEDQMINGRPNIYLVDAATVTGADTEANQAEYPQPSSQVKGCGFPMMRVLILTSLITAMVRSVAVEAYRGKGTGESALYRVVSDTIPEGSIVVGDRYYCSYFMFCQSQKKGIDVVTRLTNKRLHEMKKHNNYQRLPNGDLLVTWKRPRRPEWMTQEEYDTIPETLTVRLVEVYIKEKGFRVQHLWVVTTLIDPEKDSNEFLKELYHRRWHVELDINSLKTMMDLNELSCKTPHMMRLELLMGILAYNLIRLTMLNTATQMKLKPRELSFTSSMTTIAMSWTSVFFMEDELLRVFVENNIKEMSKHRVGHRPGRVEPRVVKRRPKPYPKMKEPRSVLREKSLAPENTGKS